MPREFMPVTLWRDSLCFWMRMAQANAEFGLRMWQAMGFPPPRPLDRVVEAVCEAAAKPAEVPDPAPRAISPDTTEAPAPVAKPTAVRPAPARKPAVRKPAVRSVPAE